jgi:hypothetical protein
VDWVGLTTGEHGIYNNNVKLLWGARKFNKRQRRRVVKLLWGARKINKRQRRRVVKLWGARKINKRQLCWQLKLIGEHGFL